MGLYKIIGKDSNAPPFPCIETTTYLQRFIYAIAMECLRWDNPGVDISDQKINPENLGDLEGLWTKFLDTMSAGDKLSFVLSFRYRDYLHLTNLDTDICSVALEPGQSYQVYANEGDLIPRSYLGKEWEEWGNWLVTLNYDKEGQPILTFQPVDVVPLIENVEWC